MHTNECVPSHTICISFGISCSDSQNVPWCEWKEISFVLNKIGFDTVAETMEFNVNSVNLSGYVGLEGQLWNICRMCNHCVLSMSGVDLMFCAINTLHMRVDAEWANVWADMSRKTLSWRSDIVTHGCIRCDITWIYGYQTRCQSIIQLLGLLSGFPVTLSYW